MLSGNEIHGEMRRGLSSLRSFHVASRRPETMKVGSGQCAVCSVDHFTAHRPLPTAHYFLRRLSLLIIVFGLLLSGCRRVASGESADILLTGGKGYTFT